VKKRLAVAFTGPSNSGKTTLIQKIATILIKEHNLSISIIKNDPKDKAQFDVAGKDSHRFFATGAEVVVTSPTRTTYFARHHKNLNDIIGMVNDFDILLVEGLKTLPLPRIGIFREQFNEDYLYAIEAIASDDTIDDNTLPQNLDKLNLNDPHQIIEWIMKNAKKV
jgi:molybdopterin-guanine dinucleotide biosynthesis protein B